MSLSSQLPADVQQALTEAAVRHQLDVFGGGLRRTSSRFCLGIEHGDYNGTQLLGVGTDRFIWLAFKPNGTRRVRLTSTNFPKEGCVEFDVGHTREANTVADRWARFPLGVDRILHRAGLGPRHGFDGVVHGNIPGGGMSRSASLCLNLILTSLEVSRLEVPSGMEVARLAQRVENDYIGSPCGMLDQVMIYFARDATATHYDPATGDVRYIPLGEGSSFLLAVLDTGTDRPGLEKSTYPLRRSECERLVRLAAEPFGIRCLADVRDEALYRQIRERLGASHPELIKRLKYVYEAQQRFPAMLRAWRAGDAHEIGRIFRADGEGLRDDYEISGPELDSMCAIARGVDGVLGERLLGGGDKGAVGAIVEPWAAEPLRAAVEHAYPQRHPEYRAAVHFCQPVAGIVDLAPLPKP